jgi:phage-related protein
MSKKPTLKPVRWVPPSYEELVALPRDVQHAIGLALMMAQGGGKHPATKPLKGFKGAGVLEIIEDHDGDTHRAIYTVRFAGVVYVLHVFQKKSKKGIETPKHVMDLIRARLRTAETDYRKQKAAE